MHAIGKPFFHIITGAVLAAGVVAVTTFSPRVASQSLESPNLDDIRSGEGCAREGVFFSDRFSNPEVNATSSVTTRVWFSEFELENEGLIPGLSQDAFDASEDTVLCDGSTITAQEAINQEVLGFIDALMDMAAFRGGTGNPTDTRLNDNGYERGMQRLDGGFRMNGLAAGDAFGMPWGMWAGYQHDWFDNDFAPTRYDADTDAYMVGIDFLPSDWAMAGVAYRYGNTDIDTDFNQGEQEIDSHTIAPYLAVGLSEYLGLDFALTMDFTGGVSWVDIDQYRVLPGTQFQISGQTESDRTFFSTNLNAASDFGDFYLSGFLGVIVASEDVDGFVESDGSVIPDRDIDLGTFRVGGDVAYSFDTIEPFARVTYEYNYEFDEIRLVSGAQPSNDDDQFRIGVGARYFGNDWLSGTFEWNTVVGRKDFDSNTVRIQLRADF